MKIDIRGGGEIKKSNPRAKLNGFYPRGGEIVLSTMARHTNFHSEFEINFESDLILERNY